MKIKNWIPYRINPGVLERITLTVEMEWNRQAEERENKFFVWLDEMTRSLDYRVEPFYQSNGLLEILEVITGKGRVYRIQGSVFWNHLLALILEIEKSGANWIDCDWYYAEEVERRSQFYRAFRFVVFDRQEILINQTLVLTTQTQVPALNQVFETQDKASFEMKHLYKKGQLKLLHELFPTQPIKKPKTDFWGSLKKLLNRYFLKNHRNR